MSYDRNPVAALQTIIASRKRISIDGVFGTETLTAMSALNDLDRSVVKAAADMMKVGIPGSLISNSEVAKIASVVSAKTRVPKSYLLMAVGLENVPTMNGFAVEFQGTYRGLGQFDRVTWDAVMPDNDYSFVTDHRLSMLAIARLYNRNKQSFTAQGSPTYLYSDSIAYLYHNQGASQARKFLMTGELTYPGQSSSALVLFNKARSEYERKT